MFRFKEINLHYWDHWDSLRLALDADLIVITGINGSGKSTLLDALRLLLGSIRFAENRPMRNYVRGEGALVYAVVTNTAPKGSQRPFFPERITTDEATIACAVLPKTTGDNFERRYGVFEGRPDLAWLRKYFYTDGKGMGPQNYSRAMENAGVSPGFLSVITTEQGAVGNFSKQKPTELFRKALEMLGDKRVIETFREARGRLEACQRDLLDLVRIQTQQKIRQDKVQQDVNHLDEWLQACDRVKEYGELIPAARLQAAIAQRKDAQPKLAEAKTKAAKAEANLEELARKKAELTKNREEADSKLREAKTLEGQRLEALRRLDGDLRVLDERVSRLRHGRDELSRAQRHDLVALRGEQQALSKRHIDAERLVEQSVAQAEELEAQVQRLERGLPVYPKAVHDTLEELENAAVPHRLLCQLVEYGDAIRQPALEAALGDARFALIVATADETRVVSIAQLHEFPGPVYAGKALGNKLTQGPLEFGPEAPAWLPAWLNDVSLGDDGSWRDVRGLWTAPAEGQFIGRASLEAALQTTRQRLQALQEQLPAERHAVEEAQRLLDAVDKAIEAEIQYRQIEAELADLPEAEKRLPILRDEVKSAETSYKQARAASEATQRLATDLEVARQRHEDAVEREQGDLEAAKKLRETSQKALKDAQDAIERERPNVSPALTDRAERGELQPALEYDDLLTSANRRKKQLEPAPDPSVRHELELLRENVGRNQKLLDDRQSEQERLMKAVDEARGAYVKEANLTMEQYRQRLIDLAKLGGLQIDVTADKILNDDKSIDEAGLFIRLGFPGKEPVLLGHYSFSGGQKAVGGLLVIMAMADSDGNDFFLFDEPYASLSVDRVELVAEFLKSMSSQFIITEPTSGDLSILAAADLHIALEPAREGQTYAPKPRVAVTKEDA